MQIEATRETARSAEAPEVLALPPDAILEDIASEIAGVERIDIHFPSFKDGRGFSLAARLRERGFEGELRAVGDLIPDQARLLKRAGFDRVAPDQSGQAERWNAALTAFSGDYQPAEDKIEPAFARRARKTRAALADALNADYAERPAREVLAAALDRFKGRIAVLSSFGAESAAGLAMIAEIAPDTPVFFLDTERHFAQTLDYRDALVQRLGLTNVKILRADRDEAAAEDADGQLWRRDSDACCALRKVRPLARALAGYDALITGRKRYHGGVRETLEPFEFDGVRIKVNPLAGWSREDVQAVFEKLDLPAHPMVEQGYVSIGCWPCTAPASPANVRDGRWRGQDKTECGIHQPLAAGGDGGPLL